MPHDVKCPFCTEIYHETTEHYTEKTNANGSMLIMKKKWRDRGWSDDFSSEPSLGFAVLVCPGCQNQLAPNVKLTVIKKSFTAACGKEFPKEINLKRHEKQCGKCKELSKKAA